MMQLESYFDKFDKNLNLRDSYPTDSFDNGPYAADKDLKNMSITIHGHKDKYTVGVPLLTKVFRVPKTTEEKIHNIFDERSMERQILLESINSSDSLYQSTTSCRPCSSTPRLVTEYLQDRKTDYLMVKAIKEISDNLMKDKNFQVFCDFYSDPANKHKLPDYDQYMLLTEPSEDTHTESDNEREPHASPSRTRSRPTNLRFNKKRIMSRRRKILKLLVLRKNL